MNAYWPALACCVGLLSRGALAQGLELALVLAEPIQYTRAGEFRGCGLNLTLVKEQDQSTLAHMTLSINFWLDMPGYGTTKYALTKISREGAPKVTRQSIGTTWARIKPHDALPTLRTVTGDDEAILAVVAFKDALGFVAGVLESEGDVQIGFKQAGLAYERVFYGRPEVRPETARQVLDCMDEYGARLSTQAKKKQD